MANRQPISARKTSGALATYVFNVFQILDVIHLSLDKLKDDAANK